MAADILKLKVANIRNLLFWLIKKDDFPSALFTLDKRSDYPRFSFRIRICAIVVCTILRHLKFDTFCAFLHARRNDERAYYFHFHR